MEKKTKATPESVVENTQQIKEQTAKEAAELVAKEAEAKAAAEKEAAELATGEDGILKEGQRILANYPHKNEVFMTSDGFGFFDDHDAVQHAKHLDNHEVVAVKRQEE